MSEDRIDFQESVRESCSEKVAFHLRPKGEEETSSVKWARNGVMGGNHSRIDWHIRYSMCQMGGSGL